MYTKRTSCHLHAGSAVGFVIVLIIMNSCIVCADPIASAKDRFAAVQEAARRWKTGARNEGQNWHEVLTAVDALGACGASAIDVIDQGIASEKDPGVRRVLLRALERIPDEKASIVLVRYRTTGPNITVSSQALDELISKTERTGPLAFNLSHDQLSRLQQYVEKGDIVWAGKIARFLAKCSLDPTEERIAPIVRRFRDEIPQPTSATRVAGAYVSPKVYMLNQFVLAISYFGDAGAPCLKAEYAALNDGDIRKWFAIALGYIGDREVANTLQDLALHEPDKYVRMMAIRAYAHSARQEAVPLLEALLKDDTVNEYVRNQEEVYHYILRTEAEVCLRQLRMGKIK